MAAPRMDPSDLLDLLADLDRPIRVSLHTSVGAPAIDSIQTTLGALSRPITFTPSAAVVTWLGFGEDETPEDDD